MVPCDASQRRAFGVVRDQHVHRFLTQFLNIGIGQDLARRPDHVLHPLATVD